MFCEEESNDNLMKNVDTIITFHKNEKMIKFFFILNKIKSLFHF